jgi:putative ABC transport system permease protein
VAEPHATGPEWRDEVRRRLAPLRLSERRAGEIADEIAEHLRDRYAQFVASGRSAAEAEAAVWREFESPDTLARRVHHAEHPGVSDLQITRSQGQHLMRRFTNDLRAGLRSLRRIRGATALAVLAFALGIGITTAVFSVFYGVLLKPLPYPDADRMVRVFDVQPACATCPASYTKYIDWRTRNTVFETMAGTHNRTGVVTGLGDAERVPLQRATWSVPDVFKVQPAMGRWFSQAEDTPGGDKVVVLSHQFWTDHFGRSGQVLDQSVTIDGVAHRVIGVMPAEYQSTVQLFEPLQMAPDPKQRGSHFLPVYARLKPGVTVAQAQKEMVALGGVLAKEFGHNHGIDVQSYPELVLGSIRQPLQMLMGAVSLVLLIACANIANLLLAAGAARQREFGLRAAIGATRMDLTRQVLIETLSLALAGGVLGIVLAAGAIKVFATLADQIVPRASTIGLDANVLLFALGLSLLTGVFCGLWPVLRLNPARLVAAVRESDARAGTDASSRRFGSALVIAEVALAFSLLAGSGLLLKNLLQLEARPIGFKTDHVIAFDLPLAGARYEKPEAIAAFYDTLLAQVKAVPGVENVAATSHLPMYNFGWNGEVTIEGGNPWPGTSAPLVERAWVTRDYFTTLSIPIRRGRAFDERDRIGTASVAILTSNTAEKFWPGQDPIGRRFSGNSNPGPNTQWTTVIGIVDDARSYGLQRSSPFQMYAPAEQEPFGPMTVTVRASTDNPSTIMAPIRRVVNGIDPSLPIAKVQTLDAVVSQSVSQPRLISALTSLFGALAGVLAAVGVFGVMSNNVRRERRQFGIQLALGAAPARVRRLILMRGVTLGTIGVVIGGVGAYWLTRYVASLLSDVAPTDPWVFGGTALALLAVAIGACIWPAFQAGRTDPMTALRAD